MSRRDDRRRRRKRRLRDRRAADPAPTRNERSRWIAFFATARCGGSRELLFAQYIVAPFAVTVGAGCERPGAELREKTDHEIIRRTVEQEPS